jgi:hypothetical protein
MTQRQFYSTDDIKRHAEHKGSHWFSPGAVYFFKSRICGEAYEGPGGIYFVSSERFDGRCQRRYTIRQYNPQTGAVSTYGEFQGFTNARAAKKEAAWLATGEKVA